MTKLEDVARALEPDFDLLQPDHKDIVMKDARAAVEALREPSASILNAFKGVSLWGSQEMQNGQIWHAVIDAILNEKRE